MTEKNKARLSREFGLVVGAILAILFGFIVPWLKHGPRPIWVWIVSSLLIGFAFLAPARLYPIYRLWMYFGEILGRINSRVFLTLVFFLIFAPIGVFMRLLKRDTMNRTFNLSAKSYRVLRSGEQDNYVQKMTQPF